MADIYKKIDMLLAERGISGIKMSADIGISRSFMTELRKGRVKSMTVDTAQKIADYFGVTIDYLLSSNPASQDCKTAPSVEPSIDMSDVDVAFYGGYKELSEEDQKVIRDMVKLMRERRAKKEPPQG